MFEFFDDAGLIAAMGEATRDESRMVAQRLAFVGELDARRARELAEWNTWRTDPFEEVAAEVSVVQNISRARAGGQVRMARVLRDELPRVLKVFLTGVIDFRMVALIVARTENVTEEHKPALDEALARHCPKWMRMSKPKLRDRIDLWVSKFDPAAVRVAPEYKNGYVDIEPTVPGMAAVNAHIDAVSAAAWDARLDAMAATVCDLDPRSKAQRRVDAFAAIGHGRDVLACQCGTEGCAAGAERAALSTVIVQVLAEQATVEGRGNHPGYLPGFGILPAESVRDMVADGAACHPLKLPTTGNDGGAVNGTAGEAGYRPSAQLRQFIRWRDLTCRFPGCDKPAEHCDIDHTRPFPFGPTHPSNNKLYCRTHHLIKTFYAFLGWRDQQNPDGTVTITLPTGHTFSTEAHGGVLFDALAQPTGDLGALAEPPAESPYRGLMMPKRRQTREQDRRDRINRERRKREELIAEQQRQKQAWITANEQPPPF